MHPALSFRDAAGREWSCSVSLFEILECRRRFQVNLVELIDPEQGPRIRDVDKAECLVAIVGEQLEARGVTVADFCRSMSSRVLLRAAFDALFAAIWTFQNPGQSWLNRLHRAREAIRCAPGEDSE